LPISLSQYEREVDLGRSDFSSIAFQIEIYRLQTDITLSCSEFDEEDEKRSGMVNKADSKICDFLRRVPRWKMDVGELFRTFILLSTLFGHCKREILILALTLNKYTKLPPPVPFGDGIANRDLCLQ
jgi:hypothetical protein